jgi:hypothetical protein
LLAQTLLTVLSVWLALSACSPSQPVSGQKAEDLLLASADLEHQYIKDGDKTIDMVSFYQEAVIYEGHGEEMAVSLLHKFRP